MKIIIDDFPFEVTEEQVDEYQIQLIHAGGWMGPTSPEIEAARIQGLKDSWTPARRVQASNLLKAARPNMPPSTPKLSLEHKAAIAKGMIGNQNKTGKKGGNQYTNPRG